MRALDSAAAKSWCVAHSFSIGVGGLPELSNHADAFAIPSDAGARVALVRELMGEFQEEEEVCLWIHDWAVWPSGQWGHLFQRFLLSYGISEPLEQRPCFVVKKHDADAATSVVVFAVLMLWDCYVLGASGQRFVFFSHDETGRKNR